MLKWKERDSNYCEWLCGETAEGNLANCIQIMIYYYVMIYYYAPLKNLWRLFNAVKFLFLDINLCAHKKLNI